MNRLLRLAAGFAHIHMTESDRGMLGEGNVRWDDLFRGLQEIDFNGNLVLENFSNSVPGMGGSRIFVASV